MNRARTNLSLFRDAEKMKKSNRARAWQFEKPRRGLLLNSADIHVRELKTLAFTDMNVRAIQEQPPTGLFKRTLCHRLTSPNCSKARRVVHSVFRHVRH